MRPIFGEQLVREPEPRPVRVQVEPTPPARFPMTRLELEAVRLMNSVRLGYYDDDFIRSMATQARQEQPVITERQRFHLWRLVVRYRKQLGNELLVTAQEQIAAMQTLHGVEREV